MLRILSFMAVALVLVIGLAACTVEEEDEGADPTATPGRTSAQAVATPTPEPPTVSPTAQPATATAFGVPAACRPDAWERTDSDIIATDILSRESQDLLLDSEEFAALSGELERILQLIHDTYPATESIHAHYSHFPGQVVLGVESPLREAIQNAVASQPDAVGLVTGQATFDALNARLGGVRGVRLSPYFSDYLLLCLDELVNADAATAAYSQVEGVQYAHLNGVGGDGPDIDALQNGDTWYVVFRDAWGDCPAGCMHSELMYFTVTGNEVVSVDAAQAATEPTLASLAELVGGPFSAIPPTTPAGGLAGGRIGVYLGKNPVTAEIVIVSPLVDSPAYRAGVQPGDIILAVDGKSASDWAEADSGPPIEGPEGTEVTLKVRHGDGGEEDITITRQTIGFPQGIRVDNIGIELLAGTVPGVIVNVYPSYHTRADRAGIEHNDLILTVDGGSTAGWTASEAADRFAGFEGEQFTMTVRHIDGVTEDVTLRPASEFCPLVIPDSYWGVAYLNGDFAPAGSTIEAVQGGVTWGTTTTGDAGRYDITVPQWWRDSPPCSPDGPISFRMGDLLANESVDWSSGPPKELNLTFGSPPTLTPTAAQ